MAVQANAMRRIVPDHLTLFDLGQDLLLSLTPLRVMIAQCFDSSFPCFEALL